MLLFWKVRRKKRIDYVEEDIHDLQQSTRVIIPHPNFSGCVKTIPVDKAVIALYDYWGLRLIEEPNELKVVPKKDKKK